MVSVETLPVAFCIFPLVAGYWMKHSHWWFVFHSSFCPDFRRNAPSSVRYITSECLDITRDSAIRFWTQAASAGISCVFVKSLWLNIRRNTPTRLLKIICQWASRCQTKHFRTCLKCLQIVSFVFFLNVLQILSTHLPFPYIDFSLSLFFLSILYLICMIQSINSSIDARIIKNCS